MRPKFGLITVILATIAFFWIVDIFLARVERREMQSEARHDAAQGEALLAAGHADGAVDQLRKAQAIDRDNSNYALEMAQALIADGKLDEAGSMLGDTLEQMPNNGEANLLEARLMVHRGNLQQAESYYHRAIYGIWGQNPELQRIRVRLELAELLASLHSNQELLAELIPLEAEAEHDLAVRQQVAGLYIEAGAANRAVTAYRALIRDDPEDGRNYAGLGEAQLALGNYRDAQTAFQNAIRHRDDVRPRLDLATRLAELDPTPRYLSAATKFARSNAILELARDTLARCATSDQAQKLIDSADQLLSPKVKGPITNEMAEDRLAMAQTIWEFRSDSCGKSPDETLSLLMNKLSQ
ncbi:MAG TPA: tetratricopeptide repeat protein [Bryobacteraceae bacterium]|nr:tetratricopeptide repeat protein [Bryobacteraceae bacterium]